MESVACKIIYNQEQRNVKDLPSTGQRRTVSGINLQDAVLIITKNPYGAFKSAAINFKLLNFSTCGNSQI